MKELFAKLPRLTLDDEINYLIDTCFFVWIIENQKEKEFTHFLENHTCALTSFTAEELDYIRHYLNDKTRERIRKFLRHSHHLFIIDISVHPGKPKQEHYFVKTILPELDAEEHDPSDAVILAAAIKTGADVLTRDKHDMFNVRMVNFLQKYNVKVLNKLIP